MDPSLFSSLAHVRILLLPVGAIKRASFEKWAAEIRSFETIRLGDIPADAKEEKARFMPNPLAAGFLHLSYLSHPPPPYLSPLALLRPSEFPLGVVGIATCSQNDSLSSALGHFNATRSDMFPSGSAFPLASNCFVFEESDDNTNLNLGDNLPGLVVIPSMMGNKKIYISTLLAELCSHILEEFATLAQTLETPLGNEYLNAGVFPTLPSPSDMPKPIDSDPLPRSSLPPLPSHNSQPDLVTASTLLRAKTPTPLSLKRNSSTGPSLPPSPYRHTSLPVKKRQNMVGAASSHGRFFKVLGDLFLLSGRTVDASVWYTEAIAMLKGPQDAVWHAAALEGLATVTVVDAWATSQTGNSSSDEKEPWSDVSDKLVQAIAFYSRSPATADAEANYSLFSYLYARATLRHASLLFSIWMAKGWGPLAFGFMVQAGSLEDLAQEPGGSGLTTRIPYHELERHSSSTTISRSSIASILTQVHGPWLLHLGSRERIITLEAMAAFYGAIGYRRKEAYILREVLGCIMDLVVCGRDEAGVQKTGGTGLGIQGVKLGREANRGTVGVREKDNAEGNESILRIVKYICRVHGIDLEAVRIVDNSTFDSFEKDSMKGLDDALSTLYDPFGWPELQIGIVREAIAVAEALPDYPAVAQFSLSSLKTLHPVMSHGDQHHLYSTAIRALATARRRGDTRSVSYWSGQPIVSLEVLPLPLIRVPVEKSLSILVQREADHAPILHGMADPFLYNPRKLTPGQNQVTLVENEAFDIVVTLQNPFIFDLELSRLALSTSGVQIDSKAMSVVIPSNSFHPVTISAVALEPGSLTIRGCIIQAPGGVPQEFVLPLSTDEEEQTQKRRRSSRECEIGRSKYSGLDSRPWSKDNGHGVGSSTQKSVRFLQCKVVPIQPLLRIRRTSLTHGAVMLYDGETSPIRITLENVSSLPIDFLRLTFDDSTMAPAQQALSEGDLPVFETYETEYQLIHQPVFAWDSKRHPQEIKPGEKVVVTINCFGKVPCASGAIHVSYSYIHRKHDSLQEPRETFHTRQLTYPVLVTVYHMLECRSMDILPYTQDGMVEVLSEVGMGVNRLEDHKLSSVEDVLDWCIFSIEVRNTYGLPFEVTLEWDHPGEERMTRTTLISPGSTSRIVIPIKKFRLLDDHIQRQIPTLSDRQFVLTRSSLTSAEECAQRELFWYREELFKYIRCRWKEAGGTRSGDLSLRQQRITQIMLDTIRTETTRATMSLHEQEQADAGCYENLAKRSGGRWLPAPNKFISLRIQVTNQSAAALVLILDLAFEPGQHIIYEGLLSDIPVGKLEPGASSSVEVPIAFVASGRFEIFANVRSFGQGPKRIGYGQLCAIVNAPS